MRWDGAWDAAPGEGGGVRDGGGRGVRSVKRTPEGMVRGRGEEKGVQMT